MLNYFDVRIMYFNIDMLMLLNVYYVIKILMLNFVFYYVNKWK